MKKILLILILIGCKKNETISIDCSSSTKDISYCQQLIVGNWKWEYTIYYDRINKTYFYETPVNTNSKMVYKFSSNSNCDIYINDSLSQELSYNITTFDKVTNQISDNKTNVIILNNRSNSNRYDYSQMIMCNDSLDLSYKLITDSKISTKFSKLK